LDAAIVREKQGAGFRSKDEKGIGPGSPGDQYARINENPFVKAVGGDAVSTFSIDVDTASYANVRQFLMDMRQLPPPDAVRIEELVNYFDYDYAGPNSDDEAPFAAHVEVAGCPWAPEHRLVRIGIKGREIERDKRPPSNLVFLVDVSGSMDEPNKLPLVVDGLRQLTHELGENDRVAIVVYASSEGLALESTRGDNQQAILAALDRLRAGGSTAGGAGIQLAYQIAEDHFIPGGTNRVVLCTDGDFNVGVTSTAELERLVTQKAKDTRVFLSVLGYGRGNLNDAMMQTIADRGNGNHHYVDNRREARKVLVEEMTGTLVTIAKDVKIQVEFNPAQVAGYRLVGYENRLLRTEDFNDDRKDAGEIGAGHTVTSLYEVIPAGKRVDVTAVDELKYQPTKKSPVETETNTSHELLTLKMRYKQPESDVSRKLEWPVADDGKAFGAASDEFRFAAAVAGFGMLLRNSEYRGDASYDAVAEIGQSSLGQDAHGYRAEFIDLVRRAKELQSSR
jgi:Ca-activated chloride channel family protein